MQEMLFVTPLGHGTFFKLKVLLSPMPISELLMEAIMELLLAHYRPRQ